jgi:hypothetical protein
VRAGWDLGFPVWEVTLIDGWMIGDEVKLGADLYTSWPIATRRIDEHV